MEAVILAGGKGTRLRPYTHIVPKPLMPIGEKAILEIVIDQLMKANFSKINLAVGHQADYIKNFLNGKSKYEGLLAFSHEKEALGTAGPIGLMRDQLKEDFVVVNGDTLTDLDYKDLLETHIKSDKIATIASFKKRGKMNFGVLDVKEDGTIRTYIEKPDFEHHASTGIYAFKPEVLSYIKEGEKVDIPEIINRILKDGKEVDTYEIKGVWMDLGKAGDYEEAIEFYEKNKERFE